MLRRGKPREILSDLMELRYPVYAEADLVVDSQLLLPNEFGVPGEPEDVFELVENDDVAIGEEKGMVP